MQHQLPLDRQTEIIRQRQFQIMQGLTDFRSDMQEIQRTLDFHDRVLHSCCPNEMPRFQGSGAPFQGSGVPFQGSGVPFQGSGVGYQMGGGLFKSMFKSKKSKRGRKKSKRRRRRSRTRRRSR